MTTLTTLPFLKIDEQTVSLGHALQYLQVSGKLMPLLQEIVGLHLVFETLQERSDEVNVSLSVVEQQIIDFRVREQLNEPEKFAAWLKQQGIDYATFQRRIWMGLCIEQLKVKMAEPEIATRFAAQQQDLEQVDLSCVVVNQRSLADDLHQQITSGATSFEQVALTMANATEPGTGFTRGLSERRQLPVAVQQAIAPAAIGQLIGPIACNGRWFLCRIEETIAATLNDSLKKDLQEQVFKQWLSEKMSNSHLELAIANH